MPTVEEIRAALGGTPSLPAAQDPTLTPSTSPTVEDIRTALGGMSEAPPAMPALQAAPAPTQAELQAKDEARHARLLQWRVANDTRAPEEQAEVMRASAALGWEPDVVAGDLPAARRAVEASNVNVADVVRNHPALADLMGDPRTSAIVRPDAARLAGLSKLWGGQLPGQDGPDGPRVPGFFSTLWDERKLERDVHEGQARLLGPDEELQPDEWYVERGLAPPDFDYRQARELMRVTPEGRKELRERVRAQERELAKLKQKNDGVIEALPWYVPARTARVLTLMGPEMVKSAAATAVAGAVATPAAATAVGTIFWHQETAPALYWQLSELRGKDGAQLLSDDEARTYANVGALPLGLLMSTGLGAMGVGGAASKAVVGRVLNNVVSQLPRAFMRAAARTGLEYGEHVATGALLMGVQSGLSQAYVEAAKATHGEEADYAAVKDAAISGAVQGAKDFLLISGFAPMKKLLFQYGKVSASLDDAQVLRQAAQEIQKSKLAQLAPEVAGDLLEKTGPTKEVVITREAHDSLAQEMKLSPEELAEKLGVSRETYSQGGDVTVPVSKWVSEIVMKGHEETLRPDTKMAGERYTQRELLEEIQKVTTEQRERMAQEAISLESDRRDLYSTLHDVGRESGHSHEQADVFADVLSRYTAGMAAKLGCSVREAIVRVGLPQLRLESVKVNREALMDALKLTPEERAALPEYSDLSVESRKELEALRSEVKSPAGKKALEKLAKRAYTDTLTPGGNKAAYEDFQASVRKGFFVAADLNDFKHVNDKYGHDVGDKLISAVGAAFSEASRANRGKMFRPGGDEFRFFFETKEQAEAALAAAEAGFKEVAGTMPELGDYKPSFSAGVSEAGFRQADRIGLGAKARKQAKWGDVRKGTAKPGHGESFIDWEKVSPEAKELGDRIAKALASSENGPKLDAEVALPASSLAQVGDLPEWKKNTAAWMEKNGYTPKQIRQRIAAAEGQFQLFEALGPVQIELLPVGAGEAPGPEAMRAEGTKKPGGPIRSNMDPIYKISWDASSMCVKRLEAAATAGYIQQKLNRPLVKSEILALTALFKEAGKTAPCLYCYVEAPRGKVGDFVKTGMDVVFAGKEPPETWKKSMVKMAMEARAEAKRLRVTMADVNPNHFSDPKYAKEARLAGRKFEAIYKFLRKQTNNAKANAPKPYEQYVSQFLDVPEKLLQELNGYAGMRFFSTSDFQAEHVVDLMQAVSDLALRKAKAHAYTKVPAFVEIFGNTGMKIQTSIFAKMEKGQIVEDNWQGMKWDDAKRFREKHSNVGTVLVATSPEIIRWGLDQPWVDYIIPFHASGMEALDYKEMDWQNFSGTQKEKWADPAAHRTKEPPVKEGHVRLYRGEAKPGSGKGLPQWVKDSPEHKAAAEASGRWFARTRDEADWYSRDAGEDARITYIDLPAAEAEKYLVRPDSPEARYQAAGKAAEAVEYYLPREAATGARELKNTLEKFKQIRMHELRLHDGVDNVLATKRYLKLCKERGLKPVFSEYADHPEFIKLKKDYARSDTPFRPLTAAFDTDKADNILQSFFRGEQPTGKADTQLCDKLLRMVGKVQDLGRVALRAIHSHQDIESAVERASQEERSRVFDGAGQLAGNDAVPEGVAAASALEQAARRSVDLNEVAPEKRKAKLPASLKDTAAATRWLKKNTDVLSQFDGELEDQADGYVAGLAYDYVGKARSIMSAGKAEVWRTIRIPADGDPTTHVAANQLGKAWSSERKGAGVQGRVPYKGKTRDVLVRGEVEPQHVDWEYGLTSYAYYPDQHEVSLLQHSPVRVTGLFDAGTGEAVSGFKEFVGSTGTSGEVWEPRSLEQRRRGQIHFLTSNADGSPASFNIEALRGDRSTLAHELMHFMSWSLHKVATEAGAPQSVLDDYQTLLNWAGWESGEQRVKEHVERGQLALLDKAGQLDKAKQDRLLHLKAKEERISHGWEQYLAEGQAPSPELRPLFLRFRRWMHDLYSSVAGIALQYNENYGEDINLSDDVRRVFDRILGVDQTVEDLKLQDGQNDMAGALRLSPTDAQHLQGLREAKYAEARQRLDAVAAKHDNESYRGALASARDEIRAEVDREASQSPTYVASDYLETGELRLDDQVFAPSQLPAELIGKNGRPRKIAQKDAYEFGGNALVAKLKRRGFLEKDGIPAERLALYTGHGNGTELLISLSSVPEKADAVEKETQRRFEEAYGAPFVRNAEALRAEGRDALHNPADIKEALFLRQAMVREIPNLNYGSRELELDMMRKAVRNMVDGTRVRDVLPKIALQGERKAQKVAFEKMTQAAEARDAGRMEESDRLFGEALEAYDRAILNKLMWHEAQARSEALAGERELVRSAGRTAWRQELGKAAIEYQDLNDSLIAAVGLGKGKVDPGALDRALARLQANGDDSVVLNPDTGMLECQLLDTQALRDLLEQPPEKWDILTAREASNVHDALEYLKAQAGGMNEARIAGQRESFDNIIARTEESSRPLGNVPGKTGGGALPFRKKLTAAARTTLAWIDAGLAEMEPLVERLAANDREHPLYKLLVSERFRCRDDEMVLQRDVFDKFKGHWDRMPKEMRNGINDHIEGAREKLPINIKGIRGDTEVTRGQLWMIALNLGNAGNEQRLLDGYGWKRAQVLEVLQKNMTREEWLWVQGVWDTLGSLYPRIEELEIQDKGLRPQKVEAKPFKVALANGEVLELQGGYFPARYEDVPGRKAPRRGDIETIADVTQPYQSRAATVQTHAKTRAQRVEAPINLQFRVLPDHVSQVIHDVTHRTFVKQAARLILDPRFKEIVGERLGLEYVGIFKDWAQAVATSHLGPTMALSTWDRALSYGKNMATMAAVGFNVAVPLNDLTNPLLPVLAGDLSVKHLTRVTGLLAMRWPELRKFALEKSGELQARAMHGNSLGISRELGRMMNHSLSADIQDAAYWMMETSDKATSTPVWLAKFYEGVEKHGDETAAIRDADALVRKYFPSSNASEKAAIFRHKGFFGALTFLYGFANKMYNVDRSLVMHTVDAFREEGAGPLSKAGAVGKLMFILSGQAALLGAGGAFLSGHGPQKKDDTQKKLLWALEKSAEQLLYPLPLGGMGRNGGLPGLKLGSSIYQDVKSGDPTLWLSLGASFLLLRGAGFYQVRKTAQYLGNHARRDVRRGNYRRVASGSVFGQPKTQDRQNITPLNIGD